MNNLNTHQVCTFCVMDTTASEISFNSEGRCHFCRTAERQLEENVKRVNRSDYGIERRIEEIKKRNKNKPYDAITGLSGGVDSTYATYLAHQYGLRLLAVHCDTGWNTNEATANIHSLVNKLGIDLETYVVPWEQMRDLQLSFFKASVPNCDIPQDHAIITTNNIVSTKYGIKDFISGGNITSESILPSSWGHDARDLKHIKAINKRFEQSDLKGYPTLNFFQAYFWLPFIKRISSYRILNDFDYSPEETRTILKKTLSWQDYGPKHFESFFTRFFQAYYLPEKFNFDKRKAHFSSLIAAKKMTRTEALEKLKGSQYQAETLERDIKYFCQKLEITQDDFLKIMLSSPKNHEDYPTSTLTMRKITRCKDYIEEKGFKLNRIR